MKNPNVCRYIMFGIIIIGLIVAGLSAIVYGVDNIHPLFVVGAVIAFGGVIFGIIKIRCPFCHRQLHLKGIVPDNNCPYCGSKFE